MGGTALGASGRSNNGLKLDVKTGKLSLWRLFPTFTFYSVPYWPLPDYDSPNGLSPILESQAKLGQSFLWVLLPRVQLPKVRDQLRHMQVRIKWPAAARGVGGDATARSGSCSPLSWPLNGLLQVNVYYWPRLRKAFFEGAGASV